MFFFFQAEDGIRDIGVTGVQTCALPISAVSGDRTRLIQVFWNLLNNAFKFSPEGGRVRVSLSADGGVSARVQGADDGQGIDADFLPHLFERFRQGGMGTTGEPGALSSRL